MSAILKSMTVFDMELFTVPDVRDTIQLCSDDDDAEAFLLAYSEACEDAEIVVTHNLRYIAQLIRYQDADEADRLCDLFMVERVTTTERIEPLPLFGTTTPRTVVIQTYDGCLCCRENVHKPRARVTATGMSFEQSGRPRASSKPTEKKVDRKPLKRKMLDGGSSLPS